MIKAHKIRLNPTPEQANYFVRASGTRRFVWNWAVTKNASDQPFLDLGKAFTAFFEGKAHRPKFKSKKKSKLSFYLANDQFELGDHRLWIPKLGWVNMAEKRPAAIGVDVGLNRLATLSTGEGYENQAFLRTALKKLRQANKRLHRRVKGSKNREKAHRQVARLHYRITCLRDDVLHKLTTHLAECYGIVGIEDLNFKGLLKNRRLARSFSDAALGKLLTLLASKVEQRGGQVIKVGRFFPSSKTCHSCGWKWEALRLIGLIDQAVDGIGSDDDVNLAADAG
jgi:putative transposase